MKELLVVGDMVNSAESLLDQTGEQILCFPRLTIVKQFNEIIQLDSESKIIAASNILNNCMAKYYISAAKYGETFLFFVKLENEIAGFEICSGKLVQLSGYKNKNVSDEMKKLVNSFIAENPQILEESAKYCDEFDPECDNILHISF